MKVRESRHGPIQVLHLEGEIDLHGASSLRSVLHEKAACQCRYLVLDLAAVEHIDAIGVAVLVDYLRDAAAFDGDFCVAGITDHVRSIFDIVQLQKVIPVFETIEEAKGALRGGFIPRLG